MIRLHRLNGKEIVVNCELIKFVEATPDTILTLASGEAINDKIIVRESVDTVIALVVAFKQKCSLNATNTANEVTREERLWSS